MGCNGFLTNGITSVFAAKPPNSSAVCLAMPYCPRAISSSMHAHPDERSGKQFGLHSEPDQAIEARRSRQATAGDFAKAANEPQSARIAGHCPATAGRVA